MSLNRAIIFAHYDKYNVVDDYVYYYLKELQKNALHLIFVSTAKLIEKDIVKVSRYCSKVIVRENIGYDFMSYKVGLESFNYLEYDEVILCNDSVYGPLYPLTTLFSDMKNQECDFWGITESNVLNYHLQSYFLVFRKQVLSSLIFKNFFDTIKILKNKNDIIEQYEIGLSQQLLRNSFNL